MEFIIKLINIFLWKLCSALLDIYFLGQSAKKEKNSSIMLYHTCNQNIGIVRLTSEQIFFLLNDAA